MSNPPSNTRRFINAAWSLLSFQLIAAIGAVGVTGWAVLSAGDQKTEAARGVDDGDASQDGTVGGGEPPPPVDGQDHASQVAPFGTGPGVAPPPPPTPPTQTECKPSGQRIRVPANVQWCDTGLDLRAGDLVTLREMTGGWTNQGEPNLRAEGYAGYRYPNTIVADADLAALVGKVADVPFAIGATSSFTLPASGRLYFSINDTPGTFDDNQGALEFTLSVTRLE